MSKNLCLLLLFIPVFGWSTIKPYEWEKTRARYALSADESAKAEYIIKDHVQYDYALEEDQFLMYATHHRIVLVNNNEAIQNNNRIIISMYNALELTDVRARAINKDGKVVNFDINNLKEVKDEGSDKSYRIFAIEGIEVGSEVEYFFTRKMYAFLFDRFFVQADVPVKTSSFILTCPAHLQFDFKSYLGLPDVTREEGDERNTYSLLAANIPAMKKEAFSYFDANRKRLEFKLAYNTARSKSRINTWEDAGRNFYSRLTSFTKDEEKALDKFYNGIGDKATTAAEVRIKSIEQKIKTSIQVDENARGEDASRLHLIIKNKIASKEGITRLFMAVFGKANLVVHPVLTCDRKSSRFDGSFDTWGYLDEYLLYFPATKGFIAPYSFAHRYPFVPDEFTATDGLFIEPFSLGATKSGLASVKEIAAPDYQLSFNNLDIDVAFNDDLSGNTIKKKEVFGGYNALYFTPYVPLMTKENKMEMVQTLIKSSAPDAEILEWTAETIVDGIHDNFQIDADFKSTHFLERAGPRVLLKVGELIGPQTEMYRDDERLTPVENDFNRLYDRSIRINIPPGYAVKNAGDLNFNVVYKEEGKQPFAFVSTHTINGGVLEIKISEYYMDISVPLNRYEDFRKVVNAAADFNKVTLVLEKIR
jgi:hypothetical protein